MHMSPHMSIYMPMPQVVLLIDTSFAPSSRVMARIRELDAELSVLVFLSLSKSVSRGMTTAGALVANHTPHSRALLLAVRGMGAMLDTLARPDQVMSLCNNHRGVEQRCRQAYDTARQAANRLCAAVSDATGHKMRLGFVSEAEAADGFTTSTFSFNLPRPEQATADVSAALAQRFVDLLTKHDEFKPCVSFGQDDARVYATVPATSTQAGAIPAEDKAKQAVDGVQLVRLSFPPLIDLESVCGVLEAAVKLIYMLPSPPLLASASTRSSVRASPASAARARSWWGRSW